MPPRLPIFSLRRPPSSHPLFPRPTSSSSATLRPYASAAASVFLSKAPTKSYASTQPPSHRAAKARKTQLHRTYLSLLRSTPFLLLFQHNNFLASEWVALRRELSLALRKLSPGDTSDPIADDIQIIILKSTVFASALRVNDHDGRIPNHIHGTSREAYEATSQLQQKRNHVLAPMLSGPIACVSFPVVSPPHLKAVMDLLFPEGKMPRGMDPLAAAGVQKLILLAARVDTRLAARSEEITIMDAGRIRWLAVLPGVETLRGQLVGILHSVGGGELVRSLESIGTGMVRTVDAYRKMQAGEVGETK